jgi:hypothetical protein
MNFVWSFLKIGHVVQNLKIEEGLGWSAPALGQLDRFDAIALRAHGDSHIINF